MARPSAPDTRGTRPRPRTSYLIKQLERSTRTRLDALMSEHGLTTLQYTALSVVAAQPGMPSAQLARRSFVTPQAANEMVTALEGKGLLERSPDPSNRRQIQLRLTRVGQRTLERCEQSADRFEAALFGELSDPEHARLRRLLQRCLGLLRDDPASAAHGRP